MAASYQQIRGWFYEGVAGGNSHMIVAVDSFDYSDYPIYVKPGKNPHDAVPTNGDRVMECYRLSLGWEAQSKGWVKNWDMDEPVTLKPKGEAATRAFNKSARIKIVDTAYKDSIGRVVEVFGPEESPSLEVQGPFYHYRVAFIYNGDIRLANFFEKELTRR